MLTVNRRQVNHLLFDSEFRDKLSQVSTTCPSDEKLLMMYKDKMKWAKQKKKVLASAGFRDKRAGFQARNRKRSTRGKSLTGSVRSFSLKKEKKRESLLPKEKKTDSTVGNGGRTRDINDFSGLTVIVED